MLLVKTKVGSSPIEGMGLFAAEFIPKGTRIFEFNHKVDLRVTEKEFKAICAVSPTMKKWLWRYSYQNPKTKDWIICADDARFTNHSETPNATSIQVADNDELVDVAACDIEEGEEITNDYRLFDTHPYHGMPKSSRELTQV